MLKLFNTKDTIPLTSSKTLNEASGTKYTKENQGKGFLLIIRPTLVILVPFVFK